MPHILLYSPQGGIGKSSLAALTAMELGRDIHVSAGNLKPAEVRILLHEMTDRQVWMIEEIHGIFNGGARSFEWMLTYMQDGLFPGPRGLEEVPKVTIIGTTTEIGKFPDTILQRFRIQPPIVPYSELEGCDIALELGYRAGLTPPMNVETARAVALAANNHPRIMQRILTIMRDGVTTGRIKAVRGSYLTKDGELPEVVYRRAGVTPDGLTVQAVKYLAELRAAMAPLGQKPLEDVVGLSGEAFKMLEQQLLDRQLIVKTKAGRQLTRDGIQRARVAA